MYNMYVCISNVYVQRWEFMKERFHEKKKKKGNMLSFKKKSMIQGKKVRNKDLDHAIDQVKKQVLR